MAGDGRTDASPGDADPAGSASEAGGIGSVDAADPFERLGLPPRFDLETDAIDRAWIRRAAECHPDRAADPVAAAEASRRAAALNDARTTLRDPERRADRLLRRLGGPSAAEEKGLPPAFLAGMMELRERVEEAVADADPAAREEIEREVAAERDDLIARVGALFVEAADDPDRLREIRLELNVWRYQERLLAELRDTAGSR